MLVDIKAQLTKSFEELMKELREIRREIRLLRRAIEDDGSSAKQTDHSHRRSSSRSAEVSRLADRRTA